MSVSSDPIALALLGGIVLAVTAIVLVVLSLGGGRRAGAHLDDRLGAGHLGEHTQQRPDGGGHRARPQFDRAFTGGRDDRVLRDRLLGMLDD